MPDTNVTYTPKKPLSIAVLLLVFNRLDTTKQVFEAIKKAKPPRLYIAADGARDANEGEEVKVQSVREYILSNINWDCEVKTLFRDANEGCKLAVSGAIDWFFDNEEMGIILEDDCLPTQSFFWFCEELLEKYKDDTRVGQVSGFNPLNSFNSLDDSYLFSKFGPIWGWASWRRAWSHYDVKIEQWPKVKSDGIIDLMTDSKKETLWRTKLFDNIYAEKIDTWDYQWSFSKLINSELSIVPSRNLIQNIGFGDESTHTKGAIDKRFNIVFEVYNIKHPAYILRNKIFDKEFLTQFVYKKSVFRRITTKVFNA